MKCTWARTAPRLAAMAVALAGCATLAPPPEPWKPAPVGATWVTQQRNTGSYGKDVQSTASRIADTEWNGKPALAIKTAVGTLLQQPADGRWLALLNADGKPVTTFDPPAGWSPPLAVGHSWKRPQKATNLVTGRSAEYEWGCTVAAFEKVSVPAGTFDTFRVECTTTNDSQDTYWVSPTMHPFVKTHLVRGPKHPSGPGTQDTELMKVPS